MYRHSESTQRIQFSSKTKFVRTHLLQFHSLLKKKFLFMFQRKIKKNEFFLKIYKNKYMQHRLCMNMTCYKEKHFLFFIENWFYKLNLILFLCYYIHCIALYIECNASVLTQKLRQA